MVPTLTRPKSWLPTVRALFEACGGNYLEIAELLLEHGDQPWATPLAWARKQGLADIEEILLEYGAKS